MNTQISSYLDKLFEGYEAELKRLVDINSVRSGAQEGYPFGVGPAKALDEAKKIADAHGFSMTNFDYYAGEINLGKNPEIALLAHLDVVPEGDGWTREPYNMTREGDLLYGRGTTDDKGAALAMIYAMDAVKSVLGEPETGVRLVLGCGEETGSEDMEYYFKKRPMLKYTLSPDAEYPLINIEKGRYAPTFTKKITKTDKNICIKEIKGGVTPNIVPGKASAVISGVNENEIAEICSGIEKKTGVGFTVGTTDDGVKISASGQTAHASTPELGNNAQTALIEVLCGLDTDLKSELEFLKKTFPHGETDGNSLGVKLSDKESGDLTLNFGVMHFDGETLTVNFDARCPVSADDGRVFDRTNSVFETAGYTSDRAEPTKAHVVEKDSEIVKQSLAVYEEFTGEKAEPLAIGGGTYVHEIPGGIAFGIEFPGKDYRIHGADEFADINEMKLTAKMYAELIARLVY